MRRGGRFIYALDVTDPDQPKFLWTRSNASAGYGELGQTWSEPKVRKVRATSNPVLIFGGGSPKNFALQTEPQIQEVLGLDAASGNVARAIWKNAKGGTVTMATSYGK